MCDKLIKYVYLLYTQTKSPIKTIQKVTELRAKNNNTYTTEQIKNNIVKQYFAHNNTFFQLYNLLCGLIRKNKIKTQ